MRSRVFLTAAAFALAGCGGFYKSKIDQGGAASFGPADLNYASVSQRVFARSCTSCHGASSPERTPLDTYAAVKAALPQIRQRALVAKDMPKAPVPPLDAAQSTLLAAWIEAGAPETSAAPRPEPVPPSLEAKFSILKSRIFEPKCMGCHKAGPDGGGRSKVRLDNVAAMIAKGTIVPGDPLKGTLLVSLTRESTPEKAKMPKDADALTDGELSTIRLWIQEGAKDDSTPVPPPVDPPPPPTIEATWVSLKKNVFDSKCLRCHTAQKPSGEPPDGDVNFDSLEELLKSPREAVVKGNAAESGIIIFTTIDDPEKRMPDGEAPLPAAVIELIRKWINDGAKP